MSRCVLQYTKMSAFTPVHQYKQITYKKLLFPMPKVGQRGDMSGNQAEK